MKIQDGEDVDVLWRPGCDGHKLWSKQFSLQGFDENGNVILDGPETLNWIETVEQTIADSFHSEIIEAVKRAWTVTQQNSLDYDYDYNGDIGTKAELVQFFLIIFDAYFDYF